MDDDHAMDPQENPTPSKHLPVAGEVGNGPVSYHDPVTQPTDDNAGTNNMADKDSKEEQPGRVPEHIRDDLDPGATGGVASP